MKISKKYWLAFAATLFVLAGCSKPYSAETPPGAENTSVYGSDYNQGGVYNDSYNTGYSTTNPYASGSSNYRGGGADNGDYYNDPNYGQNVMAGPQATERDRVIYFAFDSDQLDSRSVAVVREHARYLVSHPSTRVVLEGHTDERGSREYNVGLGERRAYSVRRIFQQEGVNPSQMRVLSYGEERPAANCQNENCYAKNRRVVIVY